MVTDNEPERFGVRPGALVVTRDGEELGQVKECHGPYFKVSAPRQPDYWLQNDLASPDGDRRIVMDFGKSDLEQYKVRNIHSPMRGDPGNLSDANLVGESGTSTDETRAPSNWG